MQDLDRKRTRRAQFAALVLGAVLPLQASAFEWSDNTVGWRYGTKFGEPYNPNDIAKNIFSYTHVDGWKYGSNFLNIDWLLSDDKDPKDCTGGVCTGKAQEIYLVYRGTLSLNKVSGHPFRIAEIEKAIEEALG